MILIVDVIDCRCSNMCKFFIVRRELVAHVRTSSLIVDVLTCATNSLRTIKNLPLTSPLTFLWLILALASERKVILARRDAQISRYTPPCLQLTLLERIPPSHE